MQHFVLGTAGHVDHGKTSLVKALTGIDTDRLKEEKERGITIELGFASLALPSGPTLGIVDVPGHEKFIKHMVAGAAGIDLVLMVIAADEGIMPQTKEHLHICSLLGITTGLVALTKTDLVEPEWLELVRSEIADYLQGTFLAGAPVVPVSAVNGTGVKDLLICLDQAVAGLKDKADDGIFRLPIDRIFTMKGFGTVVTGTLISDRIKVGEDIQILPENISARIRGIQVHNAPLEEAFSGQRTAINLQGIEKSTLERGNVLVRPQTVWPTRRLDVYFEYLDANTRKLRNRALVRLHTGTTEIMTRVVLLEADELSPGQKTFAQLNLASEDVVVAGDHFVLRSYSPVTTIGGGLILDPQPGKHKRKNQKVLEDLHILRDGTLAEKIPVLLERAGFGGISSRALAWRTGVHVKKIRDALEKLFSSRQAVLLSSEEATSLSARLYTQLEDRITRSLAEYHQKNPLQAGISKEELKAALADTVSVKLFNMVLAGLGRKEIIVSDKESIRLTAHHVQLAVDEGALHQSIAATYAQAGLAPPSLSDVLNHFKDQKAKAQTIVKLMLKDGELIKINEDLCFARAALEKLRHEYKAQLIRDGQSTPASFKDLTGLSRKYIIPLMEYFDASRLTVRVGDHRILREKI
ncbi:MAG: selenocysteine-specific translation elongation factor [Deltaproteobacteria bacterium]|nr:selenocysteine-specific translation elongation factor [Deltaproteobacteria bacterium]